MTGAQAQRPPYGKLQVEQRFRHRADRNSGEVGGAGSKGSTSRWAVTHQPAATRRPITAAARASTGAWRKATSQGKDQQQEHGCAGSPQPCGTQGPGPTATRATWRPGTRTAPGLQPSRSGASTPVRVAWAASPRLDQHHQRTQIATAQQNQGPPPQLRPDIPRPNSRPQADRRHRGKPASGHSACSAPAARPRPGSVATPAPPPRPHAPGLQGRQVRPRIQA